MCWRGARCKVIGSEGHSAAIERTKMDISDIKLVNRLKADLEEREEDEKERRAELFPELVEALEELVDRLDGEYIATGGCDGYRINNVHEFQVAKAALAKAKEE